MLKIKFFFQKNFIFDAKIWIKLSNISFSAYKLKPNFWYSLLFNITIENDDTVHWTLVLLFWNCFWSLYFECIFLLVRTHTRCDTFEKIKENGHILNIAFSLKLSLECNKKTTRFQNIFVTLKALGEFKLCNKKLKIQNESSAAKRISLLFKTCIRRHFNFNSSSHF
jgi:hypothetical protein